MKNKAKKQLKVPDPPFKCTTCGNISSFVEVQGDKKVDVYYFYNKGDKHYCCTCDFTFPEEEMKAFSADYIFCAECEEQVG
ncbi:MAG: hypothetical protein WC890_04290 [Candidatus Margulisiibacteriota bacterium]